METAKALRLFLDTISNTLQCANDNDEDAIETLDRHVGWHRLVQAKPTLAAMVEDNDASPCLLQLSNMPMFAIMQAGSS